MMNQKVNLDGGRVGFLILFNGLITSVLFAILFCVPFFFFGCSDPESTNVNHHQDTPLTGIQGEVKPLWVVATTGMIADLAKNIGGDQVEVKALMGVGVDPHLYKASAGDINRLSSADLILYNGLHLEAGMAGVLERLSDQHPQRVICVTDQVERSKLMAPPEFAGAYDPHVWFDVTLWMSVAASIRDALIQGRPSKEKIFQQKAEQYLRRLTELDVYVKEKAGLIPENRRVLVTAHDAFGYFGRAYGFEVKGLQGISTVSEAGTADVRQLAQFIAERRIPAIFVESSVPTQSIEAVQAAVKARGFEVKIGGELFSDAMGNPETDEGTYVGMVRHNIDTILHGLARGSS
ncbi:MAG: zinc ABC transporter substrate-binding protein [Candidatus Poribacteria bacterium]|jgi:manganese/zinc/iron transport system substrate-binding protein|nr:zinc ABC transporter substrate-binding protein [Candidatus Poribacteria bacterium]MDP6748668.1 zinc ABC transporter substrate-binding protein [Candidatus Poribacteria bacterium]MDP6997782.1 zinc ABC transporter substrate-binding protein [Candidatus Poribacteria bacterium]